MGRPHEVNMKFAKAAVDLQYESAMLAERKVNFSFGVFYPFEQGQLGGKPYERDIPAHFSGDTDDLFMRSVFKNYALEGKDDSNKPTGKFILDEVQAKALASEVLDTHKGLSGAKLKEYMDTYWAKAWGHFDVNK